MRSRRRGPFRAPSKKPIRLKRMITGIVWNVPSGEAAQDGAREIRQIPCNPGPQITDATVFPRSDEDGHYIVLVGSGDMFSIEFMTQCGRCAQKYGGNKVERQDLVSWAYTEWWKLYKERRKQDQILLHNSKRSGI